MNTSERLIAVEFLERNVIGRTVVSEPVTTRTDDGGTETRYMDQNFFSDLLLTQNGFSFNLTALTVGRRYGLDEEGEQVVIHGMDAVRVYHYDITERASSGRLLGFARFVSSTNEEFDPVLGTCYLVRMRIEDEELIVDETQIGYGDFVGGDGGRQPVASDSLYRYGLRDGRLVVHFQQSTFDVDPETLERTPTGDSFPPQISHEFGENV